MKLKIQARIQALQERAAARTTRAARISFGMRAGRASIRRQAPTVEQLEAMLRSAEDPNYYTGCGMRSRSPLTAFAEFWGEPAEEPLPVTTGEPIMKSFRDLQPTARPVRGFNNRMFYAGALVRPVSASPLWQCGHKHHSCADAVNCAENALRCKCGTVLAEQLQEVFEREFSS